MSSFFVYTKEGTRASPLSKYRIRSYKKDDEPLLNLTVALWAAALCTQKKELRVPSLNTVGFGVSINKTRGRRKTFITRANAAS
jgi:hypothetical protein